MSISPLALSTRWLLPGANWADVVCADCGISNSEETMLEPGSLLSLCIVCAWRRALKEHPEISPPIAIAIKLDERYGKKG